MFERNMRGRFLHEGFDLLRDLVIHFQDQIAPETRRSLAEFIDYAEGVCWRTSPYPRPNAQTASEEAKKYARE